VVEDCSSTVIFWPAPVVIVKLETDTLSTMPDAPPEPVPKRPAKGPLPGAKRPAGSLLVGNRAVVVEGVVATTTESPTTAQANTAATTQPAVRLAKYRGNLRPRVACGSTGADAHWPGALVHEGGAGGAVPISLSDGPKNGREPSLDPTAAWGAVGSGIGCSFSFIAGLSLLQLPAHSVPSNPVSMLSTCVLLTNW
jgi:hypothetical protein